MNEKVKNLANIFNLDYELVYRIYSKFNSNTELTMSAITYLKYHYKKSSLNDINLENIKINYDEF